MRLCAVLLAAGLLHGQAPQPSGPLELIITYRCPPQRRAAFRQFLIDNGARRFENWKQDGTLRDYRLLFNWYTDVDSWEAMAVLTFPSYDRVARWNQIEHANPGGLSRDVLEMALPANTVPADLVWQAASDGPVDHARSVYFTLAFDNPTTGDFREYANTALVPKANALIRDGFAASYQIFVNRYPGGKHWRGLLVIEYKDADALSHNPVWPTAIAREPVICDAIFPH
jgi:hypothetical protein